MHMSNQLVNEIWNIALEPIEKLKKDILSAAIRLSDDEARFLVDYYYIAQEDRKRSSNQKLALTKTQEPNAVITWLAAQSMTLEKQILRALDSYTQTHLMGNWMREIYGIGPVISAGLLAHIDITKAPTVGHIWSFAGLDPRRKWEPKTKRPWNASLKTLCWKVGQSFMKFSNEPECVYGHLYRQRKEYEIKRNEAGGNAEAAVEGTTRVKKTTDAYKFYSVGKLPPAQIDARARRWAVKIFLSHLHAEWYRRHFNQEPPKPFAIAILGHAHEIKAPETK